MRGARRSGLPTLLSVWLALGVSLAPWALSGAGARDSGRAAPTAHLEHVHHGVQRIDPHTAAPEPGEPLSHPHEPRCVLCLVGAGTQPETPWVARADLSLRLTAPVPALRLETARFRLYRSRAPPYPRACETYATPYSRRLGAFDHA